MEFHLETKVTGAKINGNRVQLQAETKNGLQQFEGDRVLVAVGRRPNLAGLNLEGIGVQFEPKTHKIPVGKHFESNLKGVFAIGDLIAGPMLAHKASEEGIAFAEQLAGGAGHVNYDAIPSVIYTWPEVASVGLTEEQLKEAKRNYRSGKFPFSASSRARSLDETTGMIKILTDAKTDRVLGVHIFGPRASDMIAEAVTIMEYHGSAEDITRMVHAHPSLSESMAEAARMAYLGKTIHA
jgi:dihydrolipoamide dehydrogenase